MGEATYRINCKIGVRRSILICFERKLKVNRGLKTEKKTEDKFKSYKSRKMDEILISVTARA